jgi:FAD:protein FMN transferase
LKTGDGYDRLPGSFTLAVSLVVFVDLVFLLGLQAMKRYFLLIFCGALVFLGGCNRGPELQRLEGHAQGTSYHITWWSANQVDVVKLKTVIDATFADIDKKISTYRDDSDLQNFNRNPSTDWQELPRDVVELLQLAGRVYRASNGCYDPTVKPLYDLWGFGKDSFHIPGAEEIAATRADVGFDRIALDVPGHRVRKLTPRVAIDLSSMGEGYTARRLSKVMEDAGITNYIVEMGGDMYVKGHKVDGGCWRIAVVRPLPGDMSVDKVVEIRDENGVSVNTSGTYRHYYDENGKRYSHIFDPRTGAPVTHDLVSATVLADDPRFSDAWATAMLCLGKEEGESIAEREGLAVYFIQQRQGKLIESSSPALQKSKAVTVH